MAGFILAANVAGYLALAYDKKAARASRRANPPDRVPERLLHAIAFLGAFPAMIYGMGKLRHKTRKRRFQFVFFAASFGSTLVWVGWLDFFGCIHLL